MKRAKTPRCSSCCWWERSNNFRAKGRDWGLCHLWGGKSGRRIPGGWIDYSYGHEPRGDDTCEHHNCDPANRDATIQTGTMPAMKTEGELSIATACADQWGGRGERRERG